MAKFTDVQLSRILGEHDCGNMSVGGYEDWYDRKSPYPDAPIDACILQVAKNDPDPHHLKPARVAQRFDYEYRRSMSHEALLELIADL